MTIRDMQDQGIEIQGNVVVKQYTEIKDGTYKTLCKTDAAIFNDKVLDMEIKYMYTEKESIIIEVVEPEE